MLYIKIKKCLQSVGAFLWNNKYTLGLFLSLFLYTTDSFAAVFGALNEAGKTIFTGLRKVVFAASTIGIACVCIAGMFGNFNWKWFVAIGIGVFVMAYYTTTDKVGADLGGAD